jgi:hypothetical protein
LQPPPPQAHQRAHPARLKPLHTQAFTDLLRLVVWLGLLGLIFIPLRRLFPLRRAPLLRIQLRADLACC